MRINSNYNINRITVNKIQKELKNNPSCRYMKINMNGKKAKLNMQAIKLSRGTKNLKRIAWINKHYKETFKLCNHYITNIGLRLTTSKDEYSFKGYEDKFTFHILELIIINDKLFTI